MSAANWMKVAVGLLLICAAYLLVDPLDTIQDVVAAMLASLGGLSVGSARDRSRNRRA